MSTQTRKVRCRNCNCVQSFGNTVCSDCGNDLLLYGEPMRETFSAAAPKAAPVSAKTAASAAVKSGAKKLATKIIAAVLVGAVAVGGGAALLGGNTDDLNSGNPASPTTKMTTPGQTNATTPDPTTAAASDPTTAAASDPTGAANPATPVTLVGEVDLSYFNSIPANAVPDMYYWADGRVTYKSEPNEKGNGIYNYVAEEAVANNYIKLLQSNGFTQVDSYYFEYKGESYASWGFNCNAVPDAEKIKLQYKDSLCHLSLYYAEKPGKYVLTVSEDLVVCDTGVRYDGSVADLSPKGPSAGAGLVQLSDGSYQTSDGRLTASLGTATILRDGVEYRANANYETNDTEEWVEVENYYRNEGIYFEAPMASLMQGDIFARTDMLKWKWPGFDSLKSVKSFKLGTSPFLILPRNGEWRGATHNEDVYEDQTARVMYYDTGNIGVFYFYAKALKGEPTEVEVLCAVSMAERSGNIDDATYVKAGNVATVKYGHHEFGTMWETYDWVILEGADKISINGVGSSCDVNCQKPGVAAVQVTYGYSKEEPDVLTGIMRTVSHSKIQVYYFIIE